MRKKVKGGISYKFDIVTIGRISVERDHNRNLYLDEAGVKLITELNAFAHSFDFQSEASVFKNANVYRFLLTDQEDKFGYEDKDYFIKNLIKANKSGKLLNSLTNIISTFQMDEPEINEDVDEAADEAADEDADEAADEVSLPMFLELIETIKTLSNLILYDDFSNIEREEEIKNDGDVETLNFLQKTKLLYRKNYKEIMKIGGTGSEDEEEKEYPLLQKVPFMKYNDIKQDYYEIGGDIFDNLTIIIGYSNMFRLCGLFSTRSKEYRFLNTLYHLLSNYPLRGAPANKNKYILDIYKKTHYTLIKIIKKLYHKLSDVKLLKPLINKIKSSYLASQAAEVVDAVEAAEAARAPVARAPVARAAAPAPDGVRRSSRIAAKKP